MRLASDTTAATTKPAPETITSHHQITEGIQRLASEAKRFACSLAIEQEAHRNTAIALCESKGREEAFLKGLIAQQNQTIALEDRLAKVGEEIGESCDFCIRSTGEICADPDCFSGWIVRVAS